MKTIKVSEATGVVLDYLVAKCEGKYYGDIGHEQIYIHNPDGTLCCPKQHWKPTTKWTQGGPIIEREGIAIDAIRECGAVVGWIAACATIREDWEDEYSRPVEFDGETPLVAAMCCYVASKLGDDVEVPEEL